MQSENVRLQRRAWPQAVLMLGVALGCEANPVVEPDVPQRASVHTVAVSPQPSTFETSPPSTTVGPSQVVSASSSETNDTKAAERGARSPTQACPVGMNRVPGGVFWVGSPASTGPKDEHPSFQTRVADFCMDETEVTVEAYQSCVDHQACTPAVRPNLTCNAGKASRAEHPINCVTWDQATEFCSSRGARLPSEVEWEYAARAGSEQRTYSWGNEAPDGRTCWKTNGSCPVRSYAAGAYGLYDIQGNVWEWTSSSYGAYPWPAAQGVQKVYRGGSWSRRFEKWMSSTLRNRFGQNKWGSHLGFRCVVTLPDTVCPYGRDGSACQSGVETAECEGKQMQWNGARCALPGTSQCPTGQHFVEAQGCVYIHRPKATTPNGDVDPTAGVSISRSPGLDADCRQYQAQRPYAFRLSGGSHHGRNVVGQQRGCKNRDVGVGWNSACCTNP